MKLLVIEDYDSLRALLSQKLISSGFSVDTAANAQQAIALVAQCHYDLLILDLGLPDMDGLTLLKRLRAKHRMIIPCLILSARDALQSRIDGLDAGADDYLVKPFEISELQARIRALLRRPRELENSTIQVGNLHISPLDGQAFVGDTPLQLSRKEHLLLCELGKKSGWVVIKDQLEDRLYGFNEESSPNAVEALVSRARRKLAQGGANCAIDTVRGLGYRLVNQTEAEVSTC